MPLSMTLVLYGLLTWGFTSPLIAVELPNTCHNQHISLSKNFSGGLFNNCHVLENNVFELNLAPENIPINASPWYAFEIESDIASSIKVVLNYSHAKHRYWPQVSKNFSNWQRLATNQFVISSVNKQLTLQLEVKPGKTWIAAQPVIDNHSYQVWLADIEKTQPQASLQIVGKSVQGRNLLALESVAKNKKPVIVLLGRQHPPEVTGALAMRAFVATIMADSVAANEF